ncbi:MAG: MBL fold metallo-hydrolase [Phycisphaerae bacterium]|jgi:phosphoribosyl 1,2-cyclic phosphodiesterase
MIAFSIQSGSNGNCVYVECGKTGVLFDAGISGLKAQRALAAHGRDIRKVAAVVISHDHRDHVCSAGIFSRKFGLPVYITPPTLEAARQCKLGRIDDIRLFQSGQTVEIGPMTIRTVPTPHDSADGVAFVVEGEGRRVGVLTDLGHVFDGLAEVVATLDGVFLESNYEPELLENGPYPEFLKARIRGPHGHISNHEAAGLLHATAGGTLKWACLAHLSEHNNTPAAAMKVHRRILKDTLPLHVASRYEPSGIFEA